MAGKISATEQIRWHAQLALNGFETLDLETAAAEAQSELRALLRLLDGLGGTDGAAPVLNAVGVEPIVEVESVGSHIEVRD